MYVPMFLKVFSQFVYVCVAVFVCQIAFVSTPVYAQSNGTLPIATTVSLLEPTIHTGEVITYDQTINTYALSKIADEAEVFGVSAYNPALVFETASGTIPVVTQGVVHLRVSQEQGPILRGDFLVTSSRTGIAMKALNTDNHVFAIALETFEDAANDIGVVLVDVDKERASSLRAASVAARTAQKDADAQTKGLDISMLRIAIATTITIGSLFFILYSFRSTIAKGIVSIGRNPRARSSIVALSFGNILFALILCAVAIFIAVAVLVLPV